MKCLLVFGLVAAVYAGDIGYESVGPISYGGHGNLETIHKGGGYEDLSKFAKGDGHDKYGKNERDYSLYDHGAYGNRDAYGNSGHDQHDLQKSALYANSDHYGNKYGKHGQAYGSSVYAKNQGHGYEKKWAYDKEYAKSDHGSNYGAYGSSYGDHDQLAKSALAKHDASGYAKYGDHSNYGKHAQGKSGHLLDEYRDAGNQYYSGLQQAHKEPIYEAKHIQQDHGKYIQPVVTKVVQPVVAKTVVADVGYGDAKGHGVIGDAIGYGY